MTNLTGHGLIGFCVEEMDEKLDGLFFFFIFFIKLHTTIHLVCSKAKYLNKPHQPLQKNPEFHLFLRPIC